MVASMFGDSGSPVPSSTLIFGSGPSILLWRHNGSLVGLEVTSLTSLCVILQSRDFIP